MTLHRLRTIAVLVAGFGLGIVAHAFLFSGTPAALAQTESSTSSLQKEIESIKGKLPDQSHTMQDVSYHFSNLWFAGQKKN